MYNFALLTSLKLAMNQQDYIKLRFRQDMLQYCLLPERTASAKKLAEELHKAVDISKIYCDLKSAIQKVCDKYLSLSLLKHDGDFVQTRPDWLNDSIIDAIVDDYNTAAKAIHCDSILPKIEKQIEMLCWNNGISNMAEAISLLIEKLRADSKCYAEMSHESVDTSLAGFNGTDDNIALRNALLESAFIKCHNAMCAHVSCIYANLSSSPILHNFIDKFQQDVVDARTMHEELPKCDVMPDYEQEYSKLIPIDFYNRNVEVVTPIEAFRISLLHLLALHENFLIETGLLTNGKLKLFTTPGNLPIIMKLIQPAAEC